MKVSLRNWIIITRTLRFLAIIPVFLLLFAACAGISESMKQAERDRIREIREADRLARGESALATCIQTRCETLNLDGMRLSNFGAINDLDHVRVLMMSDTNFAELSDIKDMAQLEELHITSTDVTDLAHLPNFQNLTVLHIEGTRPSVDKSPIGSLTKLEDLAVGNLGEGEGDFIRELPLLEKLLVSWRGVGVEANLSVLTGHPSLKNVDIGGSLPDDQTPVFEIPNLETIMFFDPGNLSDATREELEKRGVLRYRPTVIVC